MYCLNRKKKKKKKKMSLNLDTKTGECNCNLLDKSHCIFLGSQQGSRDATGSNSFVVSDQHQDTGQNLLEALKIQDTRLSS